MTFKLTYATMFNPPEELHINYEKALEKIKTGLGKEYALLINNQEITTPEKSVEFSPINTEMKMAVMPVGTTEHAQLALDAARKAFPAWRDTRWQERVRLVRRAAQLIEERLFDLSAVLSLEVGKNRMEALGDVQETADLMLYVCDQMEENQGFIKSMGKDPLVGFEANNISVLKPYGVWLVISPFNFPFALTGGPAGAALVTGNTVILKPASNTAWVVRLLADCFRDAGFPDGVVNYVCGPGKTLGNALTTCAVDGITFTGSADVGNRIYKEFTACNWSRPVILEMGGKNAVIVSRNADLEKASAGIIRSAFGLQGQKCSAASRVFIEESIYAPLLERLIDGVKSLGVGDPTKRENYMGPVISANAQTEFVGYTKEIIEAGGTFLTGGHALTSGEYAKGFYCAPTLVADLPISHRLWRHEMFLPITTLLKVGDLPTAMRYANQVDYGLTAGFYGAEDEFAFFFDHIEAGVAYANRPQGATTGAWPGFQPFGGWKASGNSGKNAGGRYYLPLYMHEQIQTTVR